MFNRGYFTDDWIVGFIKRLYWIQQKTTFLHGLIQLN